MRSGKRGAETFCPFCSAMMRRWLSKRWPGPVKRDTRARRTRWGRPTRRASDLIPTSSRVFIVRPPPAVLSIYDHEAVVVCKVWLIWLTGRLCESRVRTRDSRNLTSEQLSHILHESEFPPYMKARPPFDMLHSWRTIFLFSVGWMAGWMMEERKNFSNKASERTRQLINWLMDANNLRREKPN